MAKKVTGFLKLQVPAGAANPGLSLQDSDSGIVDGVARRIRDSPFDRGKGSLAESSAGQHAPYNCSKKDAAVEISNLHRAPGQRKPNSLQKSLLTNS